MRQSMREGQLLRAAAQDKRAAQEREDRSEFMRGAAGVAVALGFLVVFVAVPLGRHVIDSIQHRGDFDAGVAWVCGQYETSLREDKGSVTFYPPEDVLSSDRYETEDLTAAVKAKCGATVDALYARWDAKDAPAATAPLSDCDRRRLAAARGPFTDEEEQAMMQAINNDPACSGQ